MTKYRLTICLPLLGLLAGCGVEAKIDEMSREQYAATCTRLGIPAGSPDFNTCMLQQQRLEEAQIQNAMKRP